MKHGVFLFTFALLSGIPWQAPAASNPVGTVRAVDVPLPGGLYSVDQLFDQFRGDFRIRIEQLSKNYRTERTRTSLIFRATTPTTCGNLTLGRDVQIASMTFSSDIEKGDEEEMREQATYYGCSGQVVFNEIVTTRGKLLSPHTWGQVVLGQRSIELKNNETFRYYGLSNGDQRRLVEVTTQRDGKDVLTRFSALGNPLLTMREIIGNDRSIITYEDPNFTLRLDRPGSHLGFTMGTNVHKYSAIQYVDGRVFYQFDDGTTDVSYQDFQKQFSDVIKGTLSGLSYVVSMYINDLPPTKFIGLAVRGTRVLNELTAAYQALIAKNYQLVLNLLNEYIKDIQSGLISVVDNRPDQK